MKNKMKISKSIYLLISIFSISICFIGCQDPEYPTPSPLTEVSSLSSKFMFVNASSDAPALNFFLNNLPAGTNIAIGSNSANYNNATVGSIQIKSKAATGAIGGLLGSSDLIFRAGATNNTNFTAASNISYTFFVTDSLNRAKSTALGSTDPGGLRFLSVIDNLATPAAGNSHIRFFHLSPNAPAVWVSVLNGTALTASFQNRTYRTIATTGATGVNFATFVPVPAATYIVEVRTGSATGPVALRVPALALTAGKIYTIYARGLVNGTGTKALAAGIATHN